MASIHIEMNKSASPRQRVLVALSGGVDSSVAAWLLQRRGYAVEGVYMRNWEEREPGLRCRAAEDIQDAYGVAACLNIPMRTVDLSREYLDRVFKPFLEEYRAGRTPNPDVLCNQEIKFHRFLETATALGAACVATGHYARRRHTADGSWELLAGRDKNKDQSYFLHRVRGERLAQLLFPLGELRKSEVRQLAREAGLLTCDKKDSTGICFIGKRPFRAFLEGYLPPRRGPIRALEDDRLLGEHDGAWFHTIGQRRGLGLGGRHGHAAAPWYVAAKDMPQNTLYVVQDRHHPALYHRRLYALRPHWIGAVPQTGGHYEARIRHRQALQECRLEYCDAFRLEVEFKTPQWAAAPGQALALYTKDLCLGGAVIDTHPDPVRLPQPDATTQEAAPGKVQGRPGKSPIPPNLP